MENTEKTWNLIYIYKNYKREMALSGKVVGPRDFKKAFLLSAGHSFEKKKREFCLKHMFSLF